MEEGRTPKIMGNTHNKPRGQNGSHNPELAMQEIVVTKEQTASSSTTKKTRESQFTCEICIEPAPSNNKFNNKNNPCGHPICCECMSTYIETMVGDNFANIPCPHLACNSSLDPLTAQKIIPPKVFDRWCDNLCHSALQGFKTWTCPNQNCLVIVLDECGGKRRWWRWRKEEQTTCPSCKGSFCFNCKSRWQEGHKCGDILNLKEENDRKFLELAKERVWISCPGCGHCVDRIDGCRRMTCRCGTSFCYRCGRRTPCKCGLIYCNEDGCCTSFEVLFYIFCTILLVGLVVLPPILPWFM